jgi:4'-phosphopantetheinyl transferase
MSATRRRSAKSKRSLPQGEGADVLAGVTQAERRTQADRRSPNRPKFSEGWRKTIESDVVPTVSEDEVDHIDIWVAHPDSLLRAHSCLKLLTDDDWIPLREIQNAAIRHSATAARILLRLGLSRAVDREVAPSDWAFERSEHSKPTVSKDFPKINFSVAHVDELSVVAVSRNIEIGVDVESVDQNVSESVIAGFSHADEQNAVRDLLPRQRVREFLRFWTLKEAYTKMLGVGHSLDFDTIKFVLDPLALKSAGGVAKTKMPPQFESFYIPVDHGLYHVSLAIEHPEQRAASTEVQIISLAKPKGVAGATYAHGRN